MKYYELKTKDTGENLFAGHFASFKHCLEKAVEKHIQLANIDLKNKNLSNANMDDAFLPGADLTGTNLTGANLSESNLEGAKIRNASLFNTCLNLSNLSMCDFEGSLFGATDITDCIIDSAKFSTLSCFTLNFSGVKSMRDCTFTNLEGQISTMSKPPVIIQGLTRQPLIIMDRDIKSGHQTISPSQLRTLSPPQPQKETNRKK